MSKEANHTREVHAWQGPSEILATCYRPKEYQVAFEPTTR